MLGTLAVLLASESGAREAERALATLKPVPGRAQFYGGGACPLAVVDYAHTPDALEKMLLTLREIMDAPELAKHAQPARPARRGCLICVFGCGGDRDRGKRALMGAIAGRHADEIIVTSDNPRAEDPLAIIADILDGVSRNCTVIESRARAVAEAIAMARPGDVVLIAGKGHEPYQEIKGVRHRYSDAAAVQAALARYRT